MSDTIKTILGAAGIVFGAIVLFVVANAIFGDPPTKEELEKENWQRSAQACWQNYERKSITPGEKVGIAKMCEDMEAKAK